MVDDLHGCQSQPVHLRLLHRCQAPRILLPVLQSKPELSGQLMACAGHPQGFRAPQECISRHEGLDERVQVAVPHGTAEDAAERQIMMEQLGCWTREEERYGNDQQGFSILSFQPKHSHYSTCSIGGEVRHKEMKTVDRCGT